jgi:hypothetical protein
MVPARPVLYDRDAMLHRVARLSALAAALAASACKDSPAPAAGASPQARTEVVAPRAAASDGGTGAAVDAAPVAPEVHGDKWADPEDPAMTGGMTKFKEAWVYVDGQPIGVLREAELPPMRDVWIEQVELLDFKRGDTGPRERKYHVLRWRVADYLKAAGVDLKKVKALLLHGGRGTAVVYGDDFRRLQDHILFDLTGNTNLKLRVFLPGDELLHANTSYDRYAGISVIVDKPVPDVNEENGLELDGVPIDGIPYYGQPLRGGIRVYVDGRLAMVIKRNSLGDEGRVEPGKDVWSVTKMLAARGIKLKKVGAADLVDVGERLARIDGAGLDALTFTTEAKAQGAVKLSTGAESNAILIWSAGKVPPVRELPIKRVKE